MHHYSYCLIYLYFLLGEQIGLLQRMTDLSSYQRQCVAIWVYYLRRKRNCRDKLQDIVNGKAYYHEGHEPCFPLTYYMFCYLRINYVNLVILWFYTVTILCVSTWMCVYVFTVYFSGSLPI